MLAYYLYVILGEVTDSALIRLLMILNFDFENIYENVLLEQHYRCY